MGLGLVCKVEIARNLFRWSSKTSLVWKKDMWDKKCGEEKVRERDVEKKSSLDLQYNLLPMPHLGWSFLIALCVNKMFNHSEGQFKVNFVFLYLFLAFHLSEIWNLDISAFTLGLTKNEKPNNNSK